MKQFVIRAYWDADARVWWAKNDELPLTTEAARFDQLVERVLAIAPELARPGEHVGIQVTAERAEQVAVARP